MKRRLVFFTVLASLLLMSVTAKAQPKAIGARFGWVAEVSYQHTLGPGFMELGLGIPGYSAGIALDGTYNWVAYQNNSGKRDHFEFFVGGGLGLHTIFYRGSYNISAKYDQDDNLVVTNQPTWNTGVGVGLMGSIGIQYQFSFPFQIGISWRPMFGGLFTNGASGFYLPGLFDGGIAFRYVF